MKKKVRPQQSDDELYQLSKEELVETIKVLSAEIARLKAIINKDSQTSSVPPSQDLIKKSEQKNPTQEISSTKPKRTPGGQPGHEGKTRKGFGRVDRVEVLRLKTCSHCGSNHLRDDGQTVEIKQVAQLVANPIEIVEYHRIQSQCTQCGRVSHANWSDEIVPGQDLGVRLQALIGWLGNYAHMPYTKIRELIQQLGQIKIGEGTLVATNERVAQAILTPVEELRSWVKTYQPNVHVDETPWAVQGVKEWLWVVAHPAFCLFRAADTRSRAELESLLGTEYRGVLSSDDFSVYNGYPVAAQQKCLAHMLRHFKSLIKSPGLNNIAIGEVFVDLINDVFRNYRSFQTSGERQAYTEWADKFKSKLTDAFARCIPQAGATALNLLSKLNQRYDQWWYFLDHPEVPPDNNLAERALRLAVTKRKISGGSRSLSRFGDTASLLSVVQTCRSQQRSVIDFFGEALRASVGHTIAYPSLIPFSPT